MSEGGRIVLYIAILIGFFIAVAYFAGLSTDLKSFLGGVNTLTGTLQGRGPSGQLLNYPGNAPNVP
jgi:hypothetical protein